MTSKAPIRLAAFAGALCLLFAGAAVAGGAIEPHGKNPTARSDETSDHMTSPHASMTKTVRGLAVAEDDLRVVVEQPELRRDRPEQLRFRIVDEHGRTVRDFDVEHEKRMHLILARRDLTGFQHLHPAQGSDGTWSTRVRIEDAGSYRLFADFSHADEPHTLASDLRVDGAADLRPLPAPRPTAVSDGGYDVRLDDDGDDLRFAITRDGQPVKTEPYLGAGGHLVALREGDMAFLHVHPTGDGPSFAAEFPTPGRYRLFLQFKHDGRVQTVAFTHQVPQS
jgi:hypothetical protein